LAAIPTTPLVGRRLSGRLSRVGTEWRSLSESTKAPTASTASATGVLSAGSFDRRYSSAPAARFLLFFN
jgi:hypothetical protein